MNKKTLLFSLIHITIFGMKSHQGEEVSIGELEQALATFSVEDNKQGAVGSDISSFLTQHRWHARRNALTPEQSAMLGQYIGQHRPHVEPPISTDTICMLLIEGLNVVEQAAVMHDDKEVAQGMNTRGSFDGAQVLALVQRNYFTMTYNIINNGDWLLSQPQHTLDDIMEAVILKISQGNTDFNLLRIVASFFHKGYDVNKVWCWASYNNTALIQLLLQQSNANPNHMLIDRYCYDRYWTPLLCAVHSQNIASIQMLLDKEAQINVGAPQFGVFETPLSYARRMPNQAIAHYLESLGAQAPNVK